MSAGISTGSPFGNAPTNQETVASKPASPKEKIKTAKTHRVGCSGVFSAATSVAGEQAKPIESCTIM